MVFSSSAKPFAVIFDVDGVLVNSTEAHFTAWAALGRELRREFPRALFDRTFGMHNAQVFPIWFERDVDRTELAGLAQRKEELYQVFAKHTLQPISGAFALVNELRKSGVPLGIGSSGPQANVALALKVLGLEDSFSAVVTGDDVTEGKPNPEIFLKCASQLQVNPLNCVVIEDAPQGVRAGKLAGMKVIALTSSRPASMLSEADWTVDYLAEISVGSFTQLSNQSEN